MSRDKIVEMAIEIVTQEGYANLSMRYLADRLGTSTMGIYYYFSSKNELLGYLFSRHESAADHRGEFHPQDPFERAVLTADAMARFLEVHSWALAGVLDGHVGIEELTQSHARAVTESVRELGIVGDDAEETVRGIWRIVLGEAVIRSSSVPAAVGARAGLGPADRRAGFPGPSLAETIESYLVGRLARVHRHRRSG